MRYKKVKGGIVLVYDNNAEMECHKILCKWYMKCLKTPAYKNEIPCVINEKLESKVIKPVKRR